MGYAHVAEKHELLDHAEKIKGVLIQERMGVGTCFFGVAMIWQLRATKQLMRIVSHNQSHGKVVPNVTCPWSLVVASSHCSIAVVLTLNQ